MSEHETATPGSLVPRFEATGTEIADRLRELQAFAKQYLIAGEDYGTIPGTVKPTLLKPGAEKLCDVYGFAREFTIVEALEDWEHGRFAYTVKATLRSMRTRLVVSEGLGACNSMEARYRYLWVKESRVPRDQRATLPTRTTKYGLQYRVVNDDPFSQVNTYLKMAKKRALVDAVLSATRSSGLFTQDLEDLAANGVLDPDDAVTVDQDGVPEAAARPAKDPTPRKERTAAETAKDAASAGKDAAMAAVKAALAAARAAGVSDQSITAAVKAAATRPRAEWTAADGHAAAQAIRELTARAAAVPF